MLKDRLLTVLALFFAAGIAVGFGAAPEGKTVCFLVFLALTALSVGLYFLSGKRLPDWKNAAVYALIASIGLSFGTAWSALREQPYEAYASFPGRNDTVIGTVTDGGSSEDASSVVIRVEKSVGALPKGTKIRLYTHSHVRLISGDRVTAELTYRSLCGKEGRAEQIVLNAGGRIVSREYADSPIGKLRRKVVAFCEKLYSPYGQEGMAEALMIRERGEIPSEAAAAYRNAGLSHLLAISGLHLVILLAILRGLLSKTGLSKWTCDGLCLALSVLYAVLAGGSPSILRAVFMMATVTVGSWFFRSTDGISALSAALTVLLIANPYALFSLGLQLSFLSCLGLLLLQPYAKLLSERISTGKHERFSVLRRICATCAENLIISAGAVLFTFPVTALRFSEVSWIAPFMNLLIVPLFPFVLTLILLSVLCCPLWLWLSQVLAFLPGEALRGMEWLLTQLDSRGIGSVRIPGGSAWIPAAFALAAIGGFAFLKKRRFPVTLTAGALTVISVAVLALLPVSG